LQAVNLRLQKHAQNMYHLKLLHGKNCYTNAWILRCTYIEVFGLVRVCGRWRYKIFWTEFYQTFPAFIQLCFVNVNLTFSNGPEYLKFSRDFRSCII
jgi:hypothetical protein